MTATREAHPAPQATSDGLSHANSSLTESYRFCAQVAKKQAGNFYYGMRLTPRDRRRAMYAVYTWMRAADDLADEPGEEQAKLVRLKRFRQLTDIAAAGEVPADTGVSDYPQMWPAVTDLLSRFPVEPAVLHEVIDGQLADQKTVRFANFDELYHYCYQVASTVGLVSISVWGYEGGEETRKLAEYRGIALQLTNIIRDVVEDGLRGRVYIPADELAECGLDDDSFLSLLQQKKMDHRLDRLLRKQIARARSYYDRSVALEGRISPDCRPTCWAMMRIYRAILDKIIQQPERVLHERVSLSKWEKVSVAGRAAVQSGLRRVGLR